MDAAADFRLQALDPAGSWDILVQDEPTAALQMARDEQLAQAGEPTLRLFRWAHPAISTGYRQRPPSWVEDAALAARGIELVERPTGGGIAVHGTDLSCSVTVPRAPSVLLAAVMARICANVARACRACGAAVQWQADLPKAGPIVYCLTQPSPYALTVGTRKLCGLAVRAYATSWLVQGSLLVRPVSEAIRAAMPGDVGGAFARQAISLEEAVGRPIEWQELIDRMVGAWEAGDAV